MTAAVPAHGVTFSMELDPTGSPNVYTEIAEIIAVDSPNVSREATETTPHNATVSVHTVSNRMLHGELSLGINYLHEHETHSAATGLKNALYDNETRGFQFLGHLGASGVDELIISGKVLNFVPEDPVRTGQRQATVTIQPSGPFVDDGTITGTVGA